MRKAGDQQVGMIIAEPPCGLRSTSGKDQPEKPFEPLDMLDSAPLCKEIIVYGRCVFIITTIDNWTRWKCAIAVNGFLVMSYPGAAVRCSNGTWPCGLTQFPKKSCEIYILGRSPSGHVKGFLPEFECLAHLIPNSGK